MANKYEDIIRDEWEKFSKKDKLLPNIMLLGATGCGKSSLINLIFQKELAPVNDTSRGTEGFHTYRGKEHGMGVNLIDSRGYEMENEGGDSFESYYASIQRKITENRQKKPLEQIHIIWFCISIAGERVQDYDIEILKLLCQEPRLRNRIAIVLTKCDRDNKNRSKTQCFKQIITNDLGKQLPIFGVSTYSGLKLDLEDMIHWSANQLDTDDLKESFIATQMVDLDHKKEIVSKKIAGYAVTAAGIGATPIPVSDAVVLTPLQVTMSVHIIHLYGMENFASISKSLIGNVIISNLGKSLAGGLLKLIPGVGTIIGGAINAGVASAITSALGFAISEICYNSCKDILEGKYVDFSSIFNIGDIQKLIKGYMEKH